MIEQGVTKMWHHVEGPYLYQDIHTIHHKARSAEQHLNAINCAAEQLFGERISLTATELEQQITKLLEHNCIWPNGSTKVTLKLNAVGEYFIESGEPTIYAGYALRSIQPKACYVTIDAPYPTLPSSAMEQTRRLADVRAQQQGYDRAIICNTEKVVAADATRPMILCGGRTLLMHPSTKATVEGSRVIEVAAKLGYSIRLREVRVEDLAKAEEVMLLDWLGVTSLSYIGKRPYTWFVAEHFAQEMEQEYNKTKTR